MLFHAKPQVKFLIIQAIPFKLQFFPLIIYYQILMHDNHLQAI